MSPCRCSPTNRCGRCIVCVEQPALPGQDLCLDCSHAELAKRGRRKKKRKAREKTYAVSVNNATYRAIGAAASRLGMSKRAVLEAALEGVLP